MGRLESGTKFRGGTTVPDRDDAVAAHRAETRPVGRGHHATGHRLARVGDVGAAPGPVAAPLARGRLPRLRGTVRQAKLYAEGGRDGPRFAKPALDQRGILVRQRFGFHELAHRPVLQWKARLAEVVREVLDGERPYAKPVREPHERRKLGEVAPHGD